MHHSISGDGDGTSLNNKKIRKLLTSRRADCFCFCCCCCSCGSLVSPRVRIKKAGERLRIVGGLQNMHFFF